MSSGNGIDWTLELVPDSVTNSIFLGVGGTSNLLVAAGNQGSLIISPYAETNVMVTNMVGTNVVVTNQTISTFGINWYDVQPRPTTNDLQGVGVFGNLYLVTGDNGTVLTSPDGTNWTSHPTPTVALLSSVAASPDTLVATGENGTIITSPDGTNWTALWLSSTQPIVDGADTRPPRGSRTVACWMDSPCFTMNAPSSATTTGRPSSCVMIEAVC